MLGAVYACVAKHLQKCHLSSFYGWKNSMAERQNKDPHSGRKLSSITHRFVLAPAVGLCSFVSAGTAANGCLPSWLLAPGLTPTAVISQLLKTFQQLPHRNKKTLLLPG